jgi:hypothetical protein
MAGTSVLKEVVGLAFGVYGILPADCSINFNQVAFSVPGDEAKAKVKRKPGEATRLLLTLKTEDSPNLNSDESWAMFRVTFHYDNIDITEGYTYLWESSGYGGTKLTDSAALVFGGCAARPHDGMARFLLTFSGFQNRAGYGFYFFNGAFMLQADGKVERRSCEIAGDSVATSRKELGSGEKKDPLYRLSFNRLRSAPFKLAPIPRTLP